MSTAPYSTKLLAELARANDIPRFMYAGKFSHVEDVLLNYPKSLSNFAGSLKRPMTYEGAALVVYAIHAHASLFMYALFLAAYVFVAAVITVTDKKNRKLKRKVRKFSEALTRLSYWTGHHPARLVHMRPDEVTVIAKGLLIKACKNVLLFQRQSVNAIPDRWADPYTKLMRELEDIYFFFEQLGLITPDHRERYFEMARDELDAADAGTP